MSALAEPARPRQALRSFAAAVTSIPQWILIGLITAYRYVISPMTGPTCKYYPSCSHYGLEAVRRHGAARGVVLAGWRVLRCNPWSHGGVDDVPGVGEPLFRRGDKTSSVTN